MYLDDLFRMTKRIDLPGRWDSEKDPIRSLYMQTLSIDGVTVGGLSLRGKASKNHLDRDVMFQIEYWPHNKPNIPLCRIDWRPFHQHSNDAKCAKQYRFAHFTGSHLHCFHENFIAGENRMRSGNLPVAIEIAAEPISYKAFVDFSGIQFNIENMGDLPPPEWVPDMLRP